MIRAGLISVLALGAALLTGTPAATATSDAFVPVQAPALNADGSGLELNAVDCSSVGHCVAVGTDDGFGAIDIDSAGVWSAVPLSARSGVTPTDLVSVSCPAVGACVAVGTAGSQAVIETQSGSTWNGVQVTGSTGLYSASYQGALTSVSCPVAGSCAAVGQAIVNNTTTGLEDTYGLIADLIPKTPPGSGSVWSAQKAPENYTDAPESASLASVSCSAPGECRAVGYALDDSTNHYQYALIDDEKSYAWAHGAAATPDDTAGGSTGLRSISCVGDTFVCMAAGYYPQKNHGATPMIQTIDASDHSEVTTGLVPIEDTNAELLASSCASDGTCQSVGDATDSGDPTYGYGWDGYIVSHTYGAPAGHSAGVVASNTYSPGDANTVQHNETLTATSCASGGFCVAVGHYLDANDEEAGVIDTRHYDGDGNITGESDVRAPEPASDPSTDDQAPLNGAACSDSTHCVSVGTYLNDTSQPHGVIETLGGSTSPAPTITGISPSHGHTAGATSVTIRGSQLDHVTAVRFGSKAATQLHVISGTQLTVTAPRHAAGVVDVRVQNDGGAVSAITSADRYTYVAQPVVNRVRPPKGSRHGGTKVTITGQHLDGTTQVVFGTAAATDLKIASAQKLVVISPPHRRGSVDVRVISEGGKSKMRKQDRFTFT